MYFKVKNIAFFINMKEILDIKLLELYKSGLKDFSGLRIYNGKVHLLLSYIPVDSSAILKNENLSRINLSMSKLYNANLENTDLSEANLNLTNLRGANLRGANLQKANLQGANLSGANLANANLCGVDFTNTLLINTNLSNTLTDNKTVFDPKTFLIWLIVNQKLNNKDLSGIDLRGAYLENADLREVNLSYARLGYLIDKEDFGELHYCTNLSSANLTGANLKYAEIIRGNLEKANLQKASLVGANLEKANLKYAKLDEAVLNSANLTHTKLVKASFQCASLYKAILYDAKVSNSNLSRTNLRKSNLIGTSLNSVKLKEAYYDEETLLPCLFEPKNKRMIFWTEDYEDSKFLNSLLTKKIKKEKLPPPRPGQFEFRTMLLNIYKGRCVISGCNIEEVLEAAHIIPFNGLHSHVVANGLLLRADLHKLFDKYLLAIHPDTRKVVIAPELVNSYHEIAEKQIEIQISEDELRKQKKLLSYHYHQCNWLKQKIIGGQ